MRATGRAFEWAPRHPEKLSREVGLPSKSDGDGRGPRRATLIWDVEEKKRSATGDDMRREGCGDPYQLDQPLLQKIPKKQKVGPTYRNACETTWDKRQAVPLFFSPCIRMHELLSDTNIAIPIPIPIPIPFPFPFGGPQGPSSLLVVHRTTGI
ncbi:hypothetical protein ACLOJK_003270 [Asimina triloba]